MTTDPVLEQEHLILDVTEMIVELMNERGVTRSELADRLGKTKGHVSQLLSGSRNLTLLSSAAHSDANSRALCRLPQVSSGKRPPILCGTIGQEGEAQSQEPR
jgi:Helix-turn-helix